jgi:hypothetical protein
VNNADGVSWNQNPTTRNLLPVHIPFLYLISIITKKGRRQRR